MMCTGAVRTLAVIWKHSMRRRFLEGSILLHFFTLLRIVRHFLLRGCLHLDRNRSRAVARGLLWSLSNRLTTRLPLRGDICQTKSAAGYSRESTAQLTHYFRIWLMSNGARRPRRGNLSRRFGCEGYVRKKHRTKDFQRRMGFFMLLFCNCRHQEMCLWGRHSRSWITTECTRAKCSRRNTYFVKIMKNICLRKRMSQQAHAYLTIITFKSKQEHVRPSRLHAPVFSISWNKQEITLTQCEAQSFICEAPYMHCGILAKTYARKLISFVTFTSALLTFQGFHTF